MANYITSVSAMTKYSNTLISTSSYNASNLGVMSSNGILKLQGTNADIQINNVSLLSTLQNIENRLNLLTPNKEIEKDWEELAELGRQYRELEEKIKEKMKVWKALENS